jgi:putative transposase
VPLTRLARERQIVLRTARRWVERFRKDGLVGLVRRERNDKDERKLLPELQQIIEGLALSTPRLSAAAVRRKAVEAARKLDANPPRPAGRG